ncbi:formin-like protein 20 [Bidens hawaiensis]|uniref:formin-like protein 20 n=1 Tax=Bidens hawaiensis TaxID=980011 RepID=UPI00404AED84
MFENGQYKIFKPKQLLSCDDLIMLRELDMLKLSNARKEVAHLDLKAEVSLKVKWLEQCCNYESDYEDFPPACHAGLFSTRFSVFDCFLSLEDHEHRAYMGGIAVQLLERGHPDSSFMVFNFKQGGDTRTHVSSHILSSQYNIKVMDYPIQYQGCPILPLEMIHHVLKSSESWLSLAGQQNVLLMHCEKGEWPALVFVLVAFLLNGRHFIGEQKTLEMMYKHAPRELLRLSTPLNPQPSQLRYLRYVTSGSLGFDLPPAETPLDLDYIVLKFLPLFGEKGCRPVIRIYGQDLSSTTANRSSTLLFTSSETIEQACYYQLEECELVKIDIRQRVQGDVVVECVHLNHDKEEMIFRVMFHTTFVQSSVLILSRDEVDVMWDARDQLPKNFTVEVCSSDVDEEFFEVEEIFSIAVEGQDDPLPKESEVVTSNG